MHGNLEESEKLYLRRFGGFQRVDKQKLLGRTSTKPTTPNNNKNINNFYIR